MPKSVQFIQSYRRELFNYIKKHAPYFPGCCLDVALLLKYFLKQYYGEEWTIMEGNKIYNPNGKKYHVWLQKGEYVIDATLFQFYLGKLKCKSYAPDQAYAYCIEEIQHDTIIFTRQYHEKVFENVHVGDAPKYLGYYLENLWQGEIDRTMPPQVALKSYLQLSTKRIRKN